MKQRFLLLLIALVLVMAQGLEAGNLVKVDDGNVHFVTVVGHKVARQHCFLFLEGVTDLADSIGLIDPVTPILPTDPVVAMNGNNMMAQANGSQQADSDYSLSVEGADSEMFSAVVVSNANGRCTVMITYLPTVAGQHQATLKVQHNGSDGVTQSLALTGEAWGNKIDTQDVRTLRDQPNSQVLDTGVDLPTLPAEPSITVNPSSLEFGDVVVGRTARMSFTLKGMNLTGPLTLQVLSTRSSSSDGFSINVTSISAVQAAQGVTVVVTYKPLSPGTRNSTGVYISGGGTQGQVVSLSGTGVETSSIVASPASLTFDDVTVGTTITKQFTVTSASLSGSLTLSLDDATGAYSINPTSISTIQAMRGATVKVSYHPIAPGAHNASILISGNGIESKTVALSGTAVKDFSTVLITTTDGVVMEYLIDESSKVKISKPNLVIESCNTVMTYDLNQMAQMRYGHRTVSAPIVTQQGICEPTAGSILLHGLKNDSMAHVTDSNGRVVMEHCGIGTAVVSLDDEPTGEYLIKTACQTIKIVKQ